MKYKRIITSMILIITVIILICYSNVSASTNKDNKIIFTNKINNNFINTNNLDFSKNNKYNITEASYYFDTISNSDQVEGVVSIKINNNIINTNVKGTIDYLGKNIGYVGVFDGIITINTIKKHLTVDMLYINENDNFTAITIGCAGDEIPQIVFLGEYTEKISQLSSLNIAKSNNIDKSNSLNMNNQQNSLKINSVDAEIRLQETNTKTVSGYNIATISLYHANELRNQGNMSVYARINSHTDSFEEYLRNVQGLNDIGSMFIIRPDMYTIEIVSSTKPLHSTRAIAPENGDTSQTLTLGAYIPYAGLVTFGVPITMTSTTVEFRGVPNAPLFNDNIVSWSLYKRYGWDATELDWDEDNSSVVGGTAGGLVYSQYTYEGNLTNNTQGIIGAYGNIRYEYRYILLSGDEMILHMWSDSVSAVSTLTIIP